MTSRSQLRAPSGNRRPNGAPAYYMGRPASLWIAALPQTRGPARPVIGVRAQ